MDQQKLTTSLTSYYEACDHIAKMSIEQAVIDGNIEQAYYLAQKSGKSKTSDTLEGRRCFLIPSPFDAMYHDE